MTWKTECSGNQAEQEKFLMMVKFKETPGTTSNKLTSTLEGSQKEKRERGR